MHHRTSCRRNGRSQTRKRIRLRFSIDVRFTSHQRVTHHRFNDIRLGKRRHFIANSARNHYMPNRHGGSRHVCIRGIDYGQDWSTVRNNLCCRSSNSHCDICINSHLWLNVGINSNRRIRLWCSLILYNGFMHSVWFHPHPNWQCWRNMFCQGYPCRRYQLCIDHISNTSCHHCTGC
jgi:hypothetical protein